MNVTLPIHVGIISDHGIELPVSQVIWLDKALKEIRSNSSGQVVLHHGCSTEADDRAHRFAFEAGWQIEGHPAYVVGEIESRQPVPMRDQLEVVHPARRFGDRDEELIYVSDIIVAVQPMRGRTSTLVAQATDAGWQVIQIEEPAYAIPTQSQPAAANSWPVCRHDWLVDAWR